MSDTDSDSSTDKYAPYPGNAYDQKRRLRMECLVDTLAKFGVEDRTRIRDTVVERMRAYRSVNSPNKQMDILMAICRQYGAKCTMKNCIFACDKRACDCADSYKHRFDVEAEIDGVSVIYSYRCGWYRRDKCPAYIVVKDIETSEILIKLHKNPSDAAQELKSLAADIFEEEDGIQAFLTKLADMAMEVYMRTQ